MPNVGSMDPVTDRVPAVVYHDPALNCKIVRLGDGEAIDVSPPRWLDAHDAVESCRRIENNT